MKHERVFAPVILPGVSSGRMPGGVVKPDIIKYSVQ